MDHLFGKRPSRRPQPSSSDDDDDDYEANEFIDDESTEQHTVTPKQSRNMQLAIQTVSAAISADKQVCFVSTTTYSFIYLLLCFCFFFWTFSHHQNLRNQNKHQIAYRYYRRFVACGVFDLNLL